MSKFYDWTEPQYGKLNEQQSARAARPPAGRLGTPGDRRLPRRASARGLSPIDVHDDGCRDCGSQPSHGVSGAETGHGLLERWRPAKTSKGQGFQQPLEPHEHWHLDISYVNVRGTFYYLISVLDGRSRFIVHIWELRESMKEADAEVVLQRARERFPTARPRIISDNGPQFIARDFKEFIRLFGHDPREDESLLSAEQRQDRALARHVEILAIACGHTCRCRATMHDGWLDNSSNTTIAFDFTQR